jgi:hypothetical protein
METELREICCCVEGCHVLFWVSKTFNDELFRRRLQFFCPNGHGQSYQGESDYAIRLRLEAKKKELETENGSLKTRLKRAHR